VKVIAPGVMVMADHLLMGNRGAIESAVKWALRVEAASPLPPRAGFTLWRQCDRAFLACMFCSGR